MTKISIENLAFRLRQCEQMPEFQLWTRLKNKAYKGYQFLRLQPVDNYIVDMICPDLGIVIEIEGDTHDLKYGQGSKYKKLKEKGLQVIRFTNMELKKDIKRVIGKIQSVIDAQNS